MRAAFFAGLALAATLLASLAGAPRETRAITRCDVDAYDNDTDELQFLTVINAYRVEHGAGKLTISANLNRAAAWMARDMGTHAYFGHVDSLGRDPWVRTVDCGYPVAGGENLAAGNLKSSAQSAFELFRGSPSHNENMLQTRYKQIGIARVYVAGSPYEWYWATTFGTIDDGTGPASAAPVAAVSTPTQAPPPRAEAPPPAVAAKRPALALVAGSTRQPWPFAAEPVAELLAAHPAISAVYVFDAASGDWLRAGAGLPGFANTLTALEPGRDYWFLSSAPLEIAGE